MQVNILSRIMMCRSIFSVAYCNSLNKKCILRRIVEMLLFILLENFDSHTAFILDRSSVSYQFDL